MACQAFGPRDLKLGVQIDPGGNLVNGKNPRGGLQTSRTESMDFYMLK